MCFKKSGTCEETPDLFKPITHFRVLVLNFRNEEKEQFLKSFGRFCGLNRKKIYHWTNVKNR